MIDDNEEIAKEVAEAAKRFETELKEVVIQGVKFDTVRDFLIQTFTTMILYIIEHSPDPTKAMKEHILAMMFASQYTDIEQMRILESCSSIIDRVMQRKQEMN